MKENCRKNNEVYLQNYFYPKLYHKLEPGT